MSSLSLSATIGHNRAADITCVASGAAGAVAAIGFAGAVSAGALASAGAAAAADPGDAVDAGDVGVAVVDAAEAPLLRRGWSAPWGALGTEGA